MKTLSHWIKSHPYKALGFVFGFTIIPACAAVVSDFAAFCLGGIFMALLAFWAATFYADNLPIILIVALGVSSVEASEPVEVSPGVVVGVVVVCVGGYCVYRVVKFCQKKFPKETQSTNNPSSFLPTTGDGESAASWNYGSIGSCDPTLTPGTDLAASETSGTLFVIDIQREHDDQVSVRTSAYGESHTQSWADFQAQVASHGIQVTGNPDGSQYFSTNRVPCGPNGIVFDPLTGIVSTGRAGPLIEVERSRDLRNWTPFLRTRVSGQGIRIEDATTATSMFYRINLITL